MPLFDRALESVVLGRGIVQVLDPDNRQTRGRPLGGLERPAILEPRDGTESRHRPGPHAANNLDFVSWRISAGLPRALRAARPPAAMTAGTCKTPGCSSSSVPPRANWRARARRVALIAGGRLASQAVCL